MCESIIALTAAVSMLIVLRLPYFSSLAIDHVGSLDPISIQFKKKLSLYRLGI